MIETVELKRHFGKEPHLVRAVDGVDLRVADGEFMAVVGRSGSGKTTLLDCVGTLLRPTAGTVIIDGVDVSRLSDGKRAQLRGRRIGFIFQGYNLLPSLTALDNVMLPLRYSGGDRKAARKHADALFEMLEIGDRQHHRPAQLSGGEQQRVAIARALINRPAIVLGDEPTGEVDSETAHTLVTAMRRMNREMGVTFVIVTHDLDLAGRTDRIVRLSDGKVIGDQRRPGETAAAGDRSGAEPVSVQTARASGPAAG